MYYLSHKFIIRDLVEQALREDIGHGDLTVDAIVNDDVCINAVFNTRSEGIFCGAEVLKLVFEILDPDVKVEMLVKDGDKISAGQDLAVVSGNARAVLSGERLALNFIQKMSAISTITNKYQQAISPYSAKVTDTRKTTPNFRIFEKYAVKVGGGSPHRFGLFDCVMIKDNHIKLAGSIIEAVKLVKNNISHTTKIEVETENFDHIKQALDSGADIIMLDNMSVEDMKKAVELINKRAIVEASGNITLETINNVASTGVDYISTSAITVKAGALDIGLDMR